MELKRKEKMQTALRFDRDPEADLEDILMLETMGLKVSRMRKVVMEVVLQLRPMNPGLEEHMDQGDGGEDEDSEEVHGSSPLAHLQEEEEEEDGARSRVPV